MSATDATAYVAVASTFLFVPGTRADRFAKADATGADLVVVDLEDAVSPDDKAVARAHVASWLSTGARAAVRVNAVGTPWFDDDIAALEGATAVLLAKCESAGDVDRVKRGIGSSIPLVPLIETPKGLFAAGEIACSAGVVRMGFGNVDFAAEVGVDPASHRALAAARSQLVYASSAAGIAAPIDGVTTDTNDLEVLERDARHARELGFTAKLLIHPRQVAAAAHALQPTPAELDWAWGVLHATSGAVGLHDGHMVDAPVLIRARRLLAGARLTRDESSVGPTLSHDTRSASSVPIT